jgi:DNA-binding response OmpR family regulator
MDDYLSKPINRDELRDILLRLLRRKSPGKTGNRTKSSMH